MCELRFSSNSDRQVCAFTIQLVFRGKQNNQQPFEFQQRNGKQRREL